MKKTVIFIAFCITLFFAQTFVFALDNFSITFNNASGLPKNTDIGTNNYTDAFAVAMLMKFENCNTIFGKSKEIIESILLGPTQIIKNSENPKWNKTFNVNLTNLSGYKLYVFVFDDNLKPSCRITFNHFPFVLSKSLNLLPGYQPQCFIHFPQ